MNAKSLCLVLILAMLISATAASAASPNSLPYPGSGPSSLSGLPFPSGSGYPPSSGPNQLYPSDSGYPPLPNPDNLPYNSGSGFGDRDQTGGSHPATGPSSSQPLSAPSASTGNVETSFQEGQVISSEQVNELGGPVEASSSSVTKMVSYSYYGGGGSQQYYSGGIQHWALYNGYWTNGPTAVNYYGRMNTLVDNDQGQYIWSYEKYPGGYVDWNSWGYWTPGYHNTYFFGDKRGWHQVAIWGSSSGWSNVLWIYVW